jgi:hypothetical protein
VPNDLALFDLVSPYVLRGDTFGKWHAALSVIYVSDHTLTADDAGVVIRGIARFSGDVNPYIDPSKMTFGVDAENSEGHPAADPGRRDPWIDIRDAHIDFELSAPRIVSQKVATAVAAIGGATNFASAAAVLQAYDSNVLDPPPSDYASTEFTLDLLLTTVVLRPPFLRGAKLDPSGILLEDPTHAQVKITLPRIKVRLSQGSNANDPLLATLLSLGASGLDDRDDLGVAELIQMDPPYAFIGSSKCVGIGFRTATLDLSQGSTPPDVLAQFGYDDSWTGLHFPELRLYVAPHGAQDLAFDASATNLLIGIGASAGITGDFELAIVDQGSGPVKVSARFYDATGRCYSITKSSDGNTATVTIPDHTRMVVDIDGGLTPYTASARIGGAADAPGRLFDVDFGSDTSLTVVITATGSQPGATPTTLTITAARQPDAAPAPPGSSSSSTTDNPAVSVQTTSITQGTSSVTVPQLKLVSQTSSQATIALDTDPTTAAQTHWTINGTDSGVSAVITVDCAPGATVQVTAGLLGSTGVSSFTAYYRFDHPKPYVDDPVAYATIPDNTHDVPAADEGLTTPWPSGNDAATALNPLLNVLPDGTQITVTGYASFENGDNPSPSGNDWQYNNRLAANRATGLQGIIQRFQGKTFQFPATAADMSGWTSQGDPTRKIWWKAVASWPPQSTPGTTTTGTVSRRTAQPSTPVPVPDNPHDATPPPPPSWFKKIDAKVRIVRDHFVACEVSGKFDIQTPSENQLAQGGVSNAQIPQWGDVGSQNPADGIIDVRVVVQIDDATDIVTVSGYFGADPADRDGLKMIGWLPPAPDPLPSPGFGQNFLGLGVAFWPLLSDTTALASSDGAPVELAVTGAELGVVAGMAALSWFRVERVVWYGGEFDVMARPDGDELLVLVDVETAISAEVAIGSVDIVSIPRATPLVVRYKAIGFIFGNPPGQPKFQFRPYFDSSKGFTIDVSKPGTIQVHDPFDKILKILGARLSRNNPFLVEVDLGFAVDLGVVSIDRARVRLNISPGGPPEITAFGASVDIPGALSGRGYAQAGTDSHGNSVIAGGMDLTITPVNVRVAATLAVAQISAANGGPATGVQVSLEVDFPVAIPLGTSGLGIYGFLGLFAMNFERDESIVHDANTTAPALAWLKAANGDVANPQYWAPSIDKWAFGVGALLGTEGTDILLNLKGMILLELPGPRLLLMMKANVLSVPPDLHGATEGTFLAVIDLDFGRGTMTIGLSMDFEVLSLLEIKIPVEAFFDFNDTSDWHLYLGQFANQVEATVLDIFDATGYLMLSGSGIPAHANLPAVTGFSIAAGLHVSFKWGGGPLYVQVSAGFDAVVGFAPFRMSGIMTIRGTLHLFILDISAWADLHVDVGDDGHGGKIAQISGDICGEVDFLFFSISGCVSFSLGGASAPIPDPPPLVKSLKLVSRSPALVVGTGVDKPIDSGLADAVESDAGPPGGQLPVVPIDVLPALMLAMPPLQDSALSFLGQAIGGTPDGPSDGWVQRGDVWFQYTLTKLELIGPLSSGSTPATWWNTKAGDHALEAQLALLSWVPDPTPKAVGSSKYLDETTSEKWGSICQPAAPPAPVFWTFFFQILGPSNWGWYPLGLALPDPAGTIRSTPPDLFLKVTERWRSGDPFIDKLRGIVPAEIEGAAVACPGQGTPAPAIAASLRPTPNPITAIRGDARQVIAQGEALSIGQALQRFSAGQAVSSSALSTLTLGSTPAAASVPPCFGWSLASPIFDDGQLMAFGNQDLRPVIEEGWNRLAFKPGPLDDAVVFEFGEFQYARFYMWVPLRLIEQGILLVAASDAHDNLFNPHVVTNADRVPTTSLPSTWTSTSSPWQPAVFVLEELAALAQEYYVPVFVEVKGAPRADRVQIGCPPGTRAVRSQLALRPFYVGGIEALKMSELDRSSYDTIQQQKKQGVLQTALGLDSADNALLQQGQTY